MPKFKTDEELEAIFGFAPFSEKWNYHVGEVVKAQQGQYPYDYDIPTSKKKQKEVKWGGPDDIFNLRYMLYRFPSLKKVVHQELASSYTDSPYLNNEEVSEDQFLKEALTSLYTLDETFFETYAAYIKSISKLNRTASFRDDCLKKIKGCKTTIVDFTRDTPSSLADCLSEAKDTIFMEWYDFRNPRWINEEGIMFCLAPRENLENKAQYIAWELGIKNENEVFSEGAFRAAFKSSRLEPLRKLNNKTSFQL